MKQLDLSFNRLGDSAARALGTLMATVPLLALELEGNQVGQAVSLLPCSSAWPSATHPTEIACSQLLQLAEWHLIRTTHLHIGYKQRQQLVALVNISGCHCCHVVLMTGTVYLLQISDIGGLAVGDALKQTLCLQRLNLNNNMLSSSALSSIADAVSVNSGMKGHSLPKT
jgi:hypothetical protein